MNLQHLYYFQELARTQHYAKAAEKLHTSQPNLSYAVSVLEMELGISLFERKGRNITLTEAGALFLEYTDRALLELETGKQAISSFIGNENSSINLSFIYTLGSYFIPVTIQSFKSMLDDKEVAFHLSHDNTANILQKLKNKEIDFAFCSYVENEPDIEFVPIMQLNLVAIMPKNHPLSELKSIDLRDAAKYPLISFIDKCALRHFIETLFQKVGAAPIISCETEDDATVASLVENKFGISIVHSIPVLKHYNIDIRPIHNPQFTNYIYFVYLKGRYFTSIQKRFRKYILDMKIETEE